MRSVSIGETDVGYGTGNARVAQINSRPPSNQIALKLFIARIVTNLNSYEIHRKTQVLLDADSQAVTFSYVPGQDLVAQEAVSIDV